MRVLGLFIVVLSAFSSYGESVVKKIGENVFVSSDIDGANTISIQFKRCMANELYTFYNVSLISGGRTTTVNSAYSDNIGPYLIANSGWCGGNHLYSDNKTHTAYTVFVECLADGRALEDGETVNARKTVINVENVIYNELRSRGCRVDVGIFDTRYRATTMPQTALWTNPTKRPPHYVSI